MKGIEGSVSSNNKLQWNLNLSIFVNKSQKSYFQIVVGVCGSL